MKINDVEVTERYTEYGIRNTKGDAMFSDSLQEATWDSMLYPDAVIVQREIFVTEWVPVTNGT
jgi:hypothetical protein